MDKNGLDLSHHNKVTDWGKVKTDFIIHKCTEGTSYLDPTYDERKDKVVASYHFAKGGDAQKEADWFLKNTKSHDFYVLDWEIEHGAPVEWCRKFIERVKEKTGKDCWLYTNDARAVKYSWPKDWKFWIARYGMNTGQADINYQPKFKDWTMWQYTSRGKVEGIVGYVDLNITKTIPGSEAKDYYWQRHPRYKGVKLGNSNLSFQNYGCFTCCLAYMAGLDPLVAMEKIKQGGGYNGALIISDKARKALGLQYLGKETDINKMPDWSPSIKEVLLGKSQHFVVRLIRDKKLIYDPWTGKEQTLNFYPFRSYRKFKKV